MSGGVSTIHRIALVGLLILSGVGARAAETLDSVELAQLQRYLATLKSGGLSSASQVETLADISYPGLETTMREYAALAGPIEPHSHRAWQTLLERTSRSALLPWPMIQLYAPELGRFLAAPMNEIPLAEKLFHRLVSSGGDRRSFDLAVRLTPGASLNYLVHGDVEHQIAILEAWNRRLSRGAERRPIAGLELSVATICGKFSLQLADAHRGALLNFLANWPARRGLYEKHLAECLQSTERSIVLTGLSAQQHAPARLDLNEAVIQRLADDSPLVELALRNYAFDASADHSATLRRLWAKLPAEAIKARYNCLFAMNAHPQGNSEAALAAVFNQPFELLDVALPILAASPDTARRAIEHILGTKRGHEEALRLADQLSLKGFEQPALALALDPNREQIARQTAMLYLQRADGKIRRKLLGFLEHKNPDLRLSAIQVFAQPAGLLVEDKEEIGPALVAVALRDPSPGHRQEAIHALGSWRNPQAADLFRKILADHPAHDFTQGSLDTNSYWSYRLRLVALLALAKLNDEPARQEILELHRQGSPAERMDALLAFSDLNEAPAVAFNDLQSTEPKLVATAAHLLVDHGGPPARTRLHEFFARTPLWLEFRDSGIDDHNLLRLSGLEGAAK